ncbi:MAG TPA: two-component system response regulator [Elusimicrobia bacterium]|jgi:CheY-like chemotaxis protein|nr:two-component system response regulator [Elusimicrobiota bacterium]
MEKKKKVLVVDDEEDIVYLLQEALEDEGYQTLGAYNGQEALEIVQKEKPDLILLDIMMPKIDGYSLNQQLKKHQETQSIPVIVISGRGQLRDLFLLNQESPIADFLEKPFPVKLLLEKIEQVLTAETAD